MFSSERMPLLSTIDLKVKWLLCFASSYVQPIFAAFKRRTVGKCLCNQSIHHKKNIDDSCLQTYRRAIMLPCIDTLGCQQKEMGTKVSSSCVHCTCCSTYCCLLQQKNTCRAEEIVEKSSQ